MSRTPQELRDFLAAVGGSARQGEAWGRFVQQCSPLLLHTARSVVREPDLAMDAYAHVLAQLHEHDGERLRQYAEDPRSQFTTWLVVVARRLCLDYLRQRYGRLRGDAPVEAAEHASRRRLVDLVADELGEDAAVADAGDAPDDHLRREELRDALHKSLSQLSPDQRLLLALRFEDGQPAREIAAILHYKSVFHVYRALATTLSAIRQYLSLAGVSDAEP